MKPAQDTEAEVEYGDEGLPELTHHDVPEVMLYQR